jgi:hypothetical protein
LESLPSSEEDLTHARDSLDDGVFDKGKRKATATPSESDESSDTETEEPPHSAGVYPPTNDDEAETKRIEEVGVITTETGHSRYSILIHRTFDGGRSTNGSDGKRRGSL